MKKLSKSIFPLLLILGICMFVSCDNPIQTEETSSEKETVTEEITTSEKETVTEEITTSEKETVTEEITTSEKETVTEEITTSEKETVTEEITTIEETTAKEETTTAKEPSTEEENSNITSISDALLLPDGAEVTVNGIVLYIDSPWNETYKNICFYMQDDDGNQIYVYKLATKVEAGDIIEVSGKMGTYSGRQIAEGASAKIVGHRDIELNYEEKSINDIYYTENGTLVSVSGTVVDISTQWNNTYGNMSVTIEDSNGDQIYVYRLYTKVEMGDSIVVKGLVTEYNGKKQIGQGGIAESAPHVHTVVTDAAVAPTCIQTGLTEGSHCSVCDEIIAAQEIVDMIEHTPVTDEAVAPTCTQTGLTEGSHCSVCSTVLVEQTEVDMIEHSFEAGVCSVCGDIDKTSDEYKYSVLKKKADAFVFTCAETALRNTLKNPSSLSIMSEKIVDSDEYFRYIIEINYTATNSYGGTVTDTHQIMLRINPAMDGTFFNGGVEDYILTSDKESFGWGTMPDDFNYDAFDAMANPEEVSLKLILAYPEQYVGKYVKIKEELVFITNNIKDKKIYTYQSTGDDWSDYNYDNTIYVFYRMCDNLDDLILIDANRQKITVCGYVRQYSNSTDPYIDAYEITINKTFD